MSNSREVKNGYPLPPSPAPHRHRRRQSITAEWRLDSLNQPRPREKVCQNLIVLTRDSSMASTKSITGLVTYTCLFVNFSFLVSFSFLSQLCRYTAVVIVKTKKTKKKTTKNTRGQTTGLGLEGGDSWWCWLEGGYFFIACWWFSSLKTTVFLWRVDDFLLWKQVFLWSVDDFLLWKQLFFLRRVDGFLL